MHKQILVVIALFMGTGPGYIMMGALYGSVLVVGGGWILYLKYFLWDYRWVFKGSR